MSDPRYPIGRFTPDPNPTPDTRNRHIEQISGTARTYAPGHCRTEQKTSSTPPIGTVAGLSGRSSTMCRTAT